MQKTICLLSCLGLLFFLRCTSSSNEAPEKPTAVSDSASRAMQRLHADSMKKTNPLLILPPDSNYTGEYVDKYPNGITKFRGFYRQGERHGQWMSFFPNGLMWSEMHYDKGLRHGPNNVNFITGKPHYTGFYKNDAMDSLWVYYDSLGNVAKKVLFRESRFIKELPLK